LLLENIDVDKAIRFVNPDIWRAALDDLNHEEKKR